MLIGLNWRIKTHFFHNYATQRNRSNTIRSLWNKDGEEVNDVEEMENIANCFFHELFTTGWVSNIESILQRIEYCISEEANLQLTMKCTAEDIWVPLKGMGLTKAPDDDNFPAIFF